MVARLGPFDPREARHPVRSLCGAPACQACRVDELIWDAEVTLTRPVLVAAFEGLFDVAEVATSAARWLLEHHDHELIASIDPDDFFDFTKQRPHVSLNDAGERTLSWPANELHVIRTGGEHDLVILSGVEPHLRWSSFAGLVIDACEELDVELFVTMGAMPDAIPHTRTPMVFGSTTTPGLGRRLGLSKPQYQGPTGVVGVLHDLADNRGIPAIALRSPVPHYALGVPHPKAWQALIRHVEHVTATPMASGELAHTIIEWEHRHNEAVADNPQIAGYVRMLEQQWDQRTEAAITSGDDLAAEFENFLRDRPDNDD